MADRKASMMDPKKAKRIEALKAKRIEALKVKGKVKGKVKKGKREARTHSTREAKHIMTPGESSLKTRETHPHLWFSPQRHGARKKLWPRRPKVYNPCKLCDRVLTDAGSAAVVCYGRNPHETEVYLRCKCCLRTWKMPLAPRAK